MGKPANTISRIMGQLVVQQNGCCLWPGTKVDGYGRVRYEGRKWLVHRLLYEHFVGSVPEGMELDHFVCQNRACGNFAHVEPVTDRENCLRGNAVTAQHARKTHCPAGHAYTEENIIRTRTGARRCRACVEARQAAEKQHPANSEKTHCKNGHPYSGENLYRTARGRYCRTCRREYEQRRRSLCQPCNNRKHAKVLTVDQD